MSRTVLVYRIGQLGDTLVALPAIAEIHRRHPADRLVLVTDRHAGQPRYTSSWEVLGPTGWFNGVVYYHPAPTMLRKVLTGTRLFFKLKRLRPRVVYDLAPERNAAQIRRDRRFFTRLVGVHTYFGGQPLPKFGKDRNGSLPRIEPEWKRLLRIIGVEDEFASFRLPIPDSALRNVARCFARRGIGAKSPAIAIGPGSKMPSKRWPLDRFRELGLRILAANPERRLIVLGDRDDAPLGELLCRDWGRRTYNFAGSFSVYESAAALARCEGYVGNDTGTMHLAAMVGTPCVALFSARDYPGQWEPYGAGHVVLRHETDCAGCMLETCTVRNNECINRISVEEVQIAIRSIVSGRMANDSAYC